MTSSRIGRRVVSLLAVSGFTGAAVCWAAGSAGSGAILGGSYQPWTAAANTGAVDDGDIADVNIAAQVTLSGTAPRTAVIRYNVTAVDGLINPLNGLRLKCRFRDNGPDARVLLTLKRYSFSSGTTSTLWTLDSNEYLPSTSYQTQIVERCEPLSWHPLDFEDYAYYFEGTLTNSGSAGAAGLGLISLGPILCP